MHLLKHKRVRSRERPFICTVCGQAFTTPSYLQYHNRTHTGERPYQCDRCSKAFKGSCELRTHKTVHTTERSYKSDMCSKKLSRTDTLLANIISNNVLRRHVCAASR